ncbi:MAG: metal-dependent hydrolase [Moraxellaceae bacterium]|nr:metal-dependent hydrolase [Moraxellaceae bacterium]
MNKKKAPIASILPTRRDVRFSLPPERISDWHDAAGPVFTAFLNTFSIVLPVGERFFIDSVRAYRDQITDPELKKAVTAFIGQEAMHGREHEDYNAALFARAPIAPKFEKFVFRVLSGLTKHAPKSFALSGTIALEHFTALLADSVLREPRVAAGAEPHYAAIWRWHALEETEHKAVAFDVWTAVMGRGVDAYALRCVGLALATVIFWGLVIPVFLEVLRTEGKLTDLKGWRKFFRYTMGDIGLLRIQLRAYADYFRPGFHPWDHDNREFLTQIDDFLAEQQKLAA